MSSWLRSLPGRLRPLVRKAEVEAELDEELRFHVERQVEKNLAAGMSPREARRVALVAFGGVEQIKEQVRDERGTRLLEDLLQDLRYALRTLGKSPVFTALVVLTLALGIGATTAMFSLVNGVLITPLPYGDGERLMLLRQQRKLLGEEDMRFSVKELEDYRAQSRSFAGLAEYHDMVFTLLGRGEPELVRSGVVSANFLSLMGMQPILGRGFTPADARLGAEPVLVLSHGYWQRRFGGDPGVVGQTFEMNDRIHTVVGVLPPVPQYPHDNDVYMPISVCPTRSSEGFIANRKARMMRAFARLRPGASVGQAQAEVGTIAHRIESEHPDVYPGSWGYGATVVPLAEALVREARPRLLMLLGVTALVLVIACANVASLVLARLNRREQELAVRTALGAGRRRLLRQLLAESLLLAVAGGAVGLLLAAAGLDLLVAFAARFTQRAAEVSLDGTVLLFALGISLATGLAAGLLPALGARTDVAASLKEGKGQGLRRRKHRLQRGLVAAQLAVAFVLLTAAGLLLRSFFAVQGVDPGYRPENVLTLQIQPPGRTFDTPTGQDELFVPLMERIAALPAVLSVARATLVPMGRQGAETGIEIQEQPTPKGQERALVEREVVSSTYLETVGLKLVDGRFFDATDHGESTPVVVVSRSMARRHFADGEALGKHIALCSINSGECQEMRTIVGVVGDIRHAGLDVDPPELVYLPVSQTFFGGLDLLIRTTGDPMAIAEDVKALVHEVEPEAPVSQVQTLAQLKEDSLADRRLVAALVTLFAGLALLVTLAGVVGVVAYWVSERRREIGIRMALGAQPGAVLGLVQRQGLLLALVGVAAGGVGSLGLNRFLAGLLWGVAPTDPATYLLAAVLFLVAAWLASYLPARLAVGVDPLVVLHEP